LISLTELQLFQGWVADKLGGSLHMAYPLIITQELNSTQGEPRSRNLRRQDVCPETRNWGDMGASHLHLG